MTVNLMTVNLIVRNLNQEPDQEPGILTVTEYSVFIH